MLEWLTHRFDRHQQTQALWLDCFDQFQDCILLLDEHFNALAYNQAWQQFVQANDASHKSAPTLKMLRDFKRYIYPDDLYASTQLLHPKHHQGEHTIRLIGQQQLFWFDLRCQPVHTAGKGKNYYYFFLREQSDLIKQAALRSAQQRSLDGLLQRLPMMLYRSRNDRNWTMEYVSDGCLQVTGFSAAAFINSPLYGQRIYAEDCDYVWTTVQHALRHKQVFELLYRWIDANEEIIEVQEIGQGVYSSSDMILGVDGVIIKHFNCQVSDSVRKQISSG